MKRPEDLVKLFGMSNQLIETELDRVEHRHGVDLGRARSGPAESDNAYYPQFEQAIRDEASRMAKHYEIFYCLENSIRTLVTDTFHSEEGDSWWDSGRIPQNIHTDVKNRIQRDVDTGMTLRSTESIDFTTFGELGQIISANWDIFGAIFNSKRAVQRVMSSLNSLRGPIAHCSPLADDEILRLQLSVRDWFRLME
jgi:hypothetical protein